jgi:hypothetical protein
MPQTASASVLLGSWLLVACGGSSMPPDAGPVCQGDAGAPSRLFGSEVDRVFPKGPYLMHTTAQSAVVMWESAEACEGEVRFGRTADALTGQRAHPGVTRVHEVLLDGLQPDTRIFYQVGSCGLTSRVLDFYTAPLEGAPIRFTVLGDSQSFPSVSAQVFSAIFEERPYLTLHLGDTVGNGLVASQWQDQLFAPLRQLGHHVPTYIAIGNHEQNAPYFYEYVSYPRSIPDDPESESFYSFTHGNTFFLILDTNKLFWDVDFGNGIPVETPISRWVKGELGSEAARRAVWRIAAGHAPAYNESWGQGACGQFVGHLGVRDWLLPRLAEHRFHAYLSGHTHAYERGLVGGVLHVISGGGGGNLDVFCRDVPTTQVTRYTHHYLKIETTCDTLTLTAHEIGNGRPVFDRVVLRRDRWGEMAEVWTAP